MLRVVCSARFTRTLEVDNKVASSLVCTSNGIGIATEPGQLRLEVSAFTHPRRAGRSAWARSDAKLWGLDRLAIKRIGGRHYLP